MLGFEQKVEQLRRYESLAYTVCAALLGDEKPACKAAERVLCQLYRDCSFWNMNEAQRCDFLVKKAKFECLHDWQCGLIKSS